MKEIWKDIEGYNGIYKISNKGRVNSFNMLKPKIITQWYVRGYKYVCTSYKGEQKKYRVHRLVAKAFIPNPENKTQVNHKNGIKDDNRVENLEWCTASENLIHSHRIGLRDQSNENNNGTKLSNKDVLDIRKLYDETDLNQYQIANMFSINQAQVSRIVNNKTWSTLS